MPGLGPGIHELRRKRSRGDAEYAETRSPPRSPRLRVPDSWMPGPRPGMTSGARMERGLGPERLNLAPPMGLRRDDEWSACRELAPACLHPDPRLNLAPPSHPLR